MAVSRFVVVSAPLEDRVTASIGTQIRETVALALRFRTSVNDTIHRDDLGNKTTKVLGSVSEPGGVPFIAFCLLIAVLAIRELLLRIETRRILKIHDFNSSVNVLAPSDHKHED
tara:strand:- start:1346 stop:1687 length:342 start_codon:yes stop_codon:yes gene_type:complete